MKKYDIKNTDIETLKKWYHLMTLGRALDEKAPSYLLQSLGWSYHAPYAGHDGIQLAIGQVFTLGEDFLFPYYRDMLTVLSAGILLFGKNDVFRGFPEMLQENSPLFVPKRRLPLERYRKS